MKIIVTVQPSQKVEVYRKGDTGDSVELQATSTHIQYKPKLAAEWINLIPLSDISGADGLSVELQKTATHVQWRLIGGTWADLFALADIKGDKGDTGQSAYQAAVASGYVGTEQQWIASVELARLSAEQSAASAQADAEQTASDQIAAELAASNAAISEYNSSFSAIASQSYSQEALLSVRGYQSEKPIVAVNPTIVLQPGYNLYSLTLSQNSIISFNTSQLDPTNKGWVFILKISMASLYSITWPTTIFWSGGSDFSRVGEYWYNFYSDNGGLSWIAVRMFEKTQYYNPLTNKVVYVDAAKSDDTGNGLTWSTAKKNVQTAIDLAISGDVVFVKAGTYLPTTERTPGTARSKSFIMKSGVHLYGGFQGAETSPGERVMTRTTEVMPLPYGDYIMNIDIPAYPSILSGDLDENSADGGQATTAQGNRFTNITNNAYSVVFASVATFTTINGFQIQGGNSTTYGGGILSTNASLNVASCLIMNNSANTNGAGVYIASLSNCIIKNNTSNAGSGGGASASTITGCLILLNYASGFGGGTNGSNCTCCKITQNYANTYAGGCWQGTLINCECSYNSASGNGGGFGQPSALNCSIHHNTANNGGGIYGGSAVNCDINNNRARAVGGGVQLATCTNCKCHNNYAESSGGASDCTLINCTIARNQALNYHGGIYNSALKNCVVWGNRTGVTPHNRTETGANAVTYCAFENEVIAGVGNINLNATNDAVGGPYFINPSPNAGFTEAATDYDITTDSALKNAGLDSYLTTGEGATYDLKHRTRKVGTIDIGAFEFPS